MPKTALVIGATGLVGRCLVDKLIADERFEKVLAFVRRSTGKQNRKLEEHPIDFDRPEPWQDRVKGDVLFSALGTTLRKAGSKEAQYKIDYTYQYNTARAAAENGVPQYVLVSSAGASPRSRIFYSRMKGELEEAVKHLPFQHISIIQPGMLAGKREEFRLGERIALPLLNVLHRVPGLGAYKPIDACLVAQAMINVCFKNEKRIRLFIFGLPTIPKQARTRTNAYG